MWRSPESSRDPIKTIAIPLGYVPPAGLDVVCGPSFIDLSLARDRGHRLRPPLDAFGVAGDCPSVASQDPSDGHRPLQPAPEGIIVNRPEQGAHVQETQFEGDELRHGFAQLGARSRQPVSGSRKHWQ